MPDQEVVKEFPEISSKLAAPKKISAFEKERQDAAAKRQREEEETAAALKDFEDEFGVEEDAAGPPGGFAGSRSISGGYGMPSIPPRTGLGTLDSMPGAPPNQKRKRELEAMRDASMFGDDEEFEHDTTNFSRPSGLQSNRRQDDAPKPTVQLSSLPLGTTEKIIMELLKDRLPVHSVRLIPPDVGTSARRSLSAIATLESGTTNAQIDNAVSALKDTYMGLGHFLSISRHLSSAALHPSISGLTATSSEPFGAERPQQGPPQRNAPPLRDHRGYAPPDEYHNKFRPAYGGVRGEFEVTVRVPTDIQTMRAVHLLADRLLAEQSTQRAMQLEAMLMSIPSVQQDARFAFLFDARNPAGVYYRYLLWSDDDPNEAVQARLRQPQSVQKIFIDSEHNWVLPSGAITFPDLTDLADIVDDIDYASSDEESDDEDGERRFNGGRDVPDSGTMERQYMTPLQRARLVHLLCRLPTSHTMLRKGDVARITNFAISHAGTGAEDIVGLLLVNVTKPLAYSLAAKYENSDEAQDEEDEYEPGDALPNVEDDSTVPPRGNKREDDPSSAKLVALYVISDILSASSTAGAKNAWKYRQLFEKGFELLRIFEYLGKLDKELQWGRIKAEQWKRRVGQVFDLWESWSTFKTDILDQMKQDFFEPPMSALERAAEEERKAEEEKKAKHAEAKEKIQAMKDKLKVAELRKENIKAEKGHLEDTSADVSMAEIEQGQTHSQATLRQESDKERVLPSTMNTSKSTAPPIQKKRMRAEDMFAESDED
nr:uncharacterized protein c11c11.01 [Quercus suber]